MNNGSRNHGFHDSSHTRRSSSGSSYMSFNPEAVAFNCSPPATHGHPVRQNSYSRTGRGRGKTQVGPFSLPQPGHHQVQTQQQPLMMQVMGFPYHQSPAPFTSGPSYQPMYPMMSPNPPQTFAGFQGMPFPLLPPGFQQHGQQSSGSEHHSPCQNDAGLIGEESKSARQTGTPRKSHGRRKPSDTTKKMVRRKYSAEFEAARGFEDSDIYAPKLMSPDRNWTRSK